ncbi:MAG: PstS family phosphate ABC transporter substrate-binding protein [Cytophagaceae bacterium]|nr:PstS family phosphate ABC transporter substrate-binding protein [Cytophagaceae bacterium]
MRNLLFTFIAFALLTSCGGDSIKIDGSSTVFPISEKAAGKYSKTENSTKVKVSESGTGGGFKKFARKEIDISNASRPIKKSEDSACKAGGVKYIELPIAYDGLAVVVNPQNTWVDKLTVAELKKIWEPAAQNKIMKWSQIRAGWPDIDIKLYGAGTASGTFDYFTEAIVGEAKSSRGYYNPNENDNVLVQGVAGDKAALGYFGLYYYLENQDKLKIVPIDDEDSTNGAGAIIPSMETVMNGTYQPLSRPLLIYISKESSTKKEVDGFVNFYLDNAETVVKEAKYIPLTKETYAIVKERYKNKVVGSLFLALKSTVGIKLEELLKKQ